MPDTNHPFRVLIAGSSIAGLSLALSLQKHNIDFVVLESHPDPVAPRAGASLAVLPSGFRVLDQLGCYEDVLAAVNCSIDNFVVRDGRSASAGGGGGGDGRVLTRVAHLEEHLVRRHGYPMVFFERAMLVGILYRRVLARGGRVLASKRVVGVRRDGEEGGKVVVECGDGSTYEGSVLVGADGIRSTVGRIIGQAGGGRDGGGGFKRGEDDEGLPVQYRCLFGISERVPGVGEDTLHHVTNYGSSLFAASGPNEKTYWCLFTRLEATYYGDALPPYDEKDEAETARQHGDDPVTETVKFSNLYERRIKSVSTPVHEGTLDKWYDGRCMVIGDAAHKFNPIIGLGGMSALETSAALTNHLAALLKTTTNPTTTEIESVFAKTQQSRHPRARALVHISALTQHRFAMETPLLSLMNRYYHPALGPSAALGLLSDAYAGAVSLELPEKKEREQEQKAGPPGEGDDRGRLPDWLPETTARSFPYEDELLRRPVPRGALAGVVITGLLLGLVGTGVYSLVYISHVNGTFRLVDEAVWQGSVEIPGQGMTELRPIFGGGGWLNDISRTLVAVFLPLVAQMGTHPAVLERKLQGGYFLMSVLLPVMAVIVIEGSRRRNVWTWIWSPTAWLMAAQLFGLGLVLPLYVLAFYRSSSRTAYWMPPERFVPHSFSKAIAPALVLGFVVPSVLMVGSTTFTRDYAQEVVAFWQISPALTSWLAESISGILAKPNRSVVAAAGGKKAPLEDYQGLDLAGLRRLYNVLFIVASVAHTAILLALVWTPGLSVVGAFLPVALSGPVADIADGLGIFLKFDLLLVVASMLVWCLINIVEMRRVGIVSISLSKAFGLLVAGCVVFGPGAAFVAFWKRREMKMARPELRI